jgi:uncharacterized iron-regulated protein
MRRLAPLALLLAAAAACASRSSAALVAEPVSPARTWLSPLDRDHPLAGRIWDVRAGRFSDEAALLADLTGARFALLGETHDNADHHVLQARMTRALGLAGRRPAVAFEMLATEQQHAIDAALAREHPTADAVGKAVGWDGSGWPPFAEYRPIFTAALEAGMPIVGANLPRKEIQAVVRRGAGALPAAVRARIDRQGPLSPEVGAAMREEMRDSHCGELPEPLLEPMVLGQRARDAQMAESLARLGERGGVLVTGAGHARRDRGVPAYLLDAGGRIVSVALLEVSAKRPRPADYAEDWGKGPLPFDWVIFTPRAERSDPCAGLRAHRPAQPQEPAKGPGDRAP